MPSRQEQIAVVLERLLANTGSDVTGVAAVSMDGIVLVSRLSADVNEDRLGAVAATMMGVTRRVSGELRIGGAEEVIMKAREGLFMVFPIGEQNLLAVHMRQDANLGMVRLEAREAAGAINRVL
jgi:hypothetical protein